MPAAEFQLAVECCRNAFAGDNSGAIVALAEEVDWALFLHTLRRHRVQALAWHALSTLPVGPPPDVAESLSADAAAITRENLRAAAESAALLKAFEAAGVPLLFLKGLTLGALAYPSPFLKMGWDIDVLVPGDQVAAAAEVLEARDFKLTVPAPGSNLAAWHRSRKESVWHKPGTSVHLELHSRLADNRRLIPHIGIASPRETVEIALGIVLPTLGRDELFAYLCVHGASSAWFRLKWITDLAALLHPLPATEIERLYDRSLEFGAGRAPAQALLLANRLYGTLGGSSLIETLRRDWKNRWLTSAAFAQLTAFAEPTERTFGTAAIHWTQLLLLPRWGFKLAELGRQLRDASYRLRAPT